MKYKPAKRASTSRRYLALWIKNQHTIAAVRQTLNTASQKSSHGIVMSALGLCASQAAEQLASAREYSQERIAMLEHEAAQLVAGMHERESNMALLWKLANE